MSTVVVPAPINDNHVAPVTAGGTGASTAAAARTNLDVYSKSEVTSAISQSTAHATQVGNGGLQLNSTLMAYKMILLIFRRYGYWDSLAVPVSMITSSLTTAGAFIRFSTNEIKVTISTSGLVELTGSGASDLVVEAYGLY